MNRQDIESVLNAFPIPSDTKIEFHSSNVHVFFNQNEREFFAKFIQTMERSTIVDNNCWTEEDNMIINFSVTFQKVGIPEVIIHISLLPSDLGPILFKHFDTMGESND